MQVLNNIECYIWLEVNLCVDHTQRDKDTIGDHWQDMMWALPQQNSIVLLARYALLVLLSSFCRAHFTQVNQIWLQSGTGTNWPIVPNGTNPGLFKTKYQYVLAPRFDILGVNLTDIGANLIALVSLSPVDGANVTSSISLILWDFFIEGNC